MSDVQAFLARVSKQLRDGVARVAREHAGDVLGAVEVETKGRNQVA